MLNLPKDYIEEIKTIIGDDNIDKYLSSLDLPINSGIVINNKKINNNLLDEVLNKYKYVEKYKNKYYTYKKNDEYSIGKSLYHHMGLVYAQEPSSYEVIKNLDLNMNFKFIDLCASPGGKSIDTILKQNKGIGILNEIDPKRIQALKSNIERMGFINTIITNNKPCDFIDLYEEYFDLVIVDAPCSGEGMFKKSEIAIKNWSVDYVKYISSIQREIINVAVKLVNNNGYLVYSTCTFSIEEDEKNIDYIIKKFTDFIIIKQEKIFPYNSDGEGQFFCILKRSIDKSNNIDFENENISILNKNRNDIPTEIINALKNYFNEEYLLSGRLVIDKIKNIYKIYYLNNDLYNEYIKLGSFNIKYKGLLLGELEKNNFIPSNELAHSEIINQYKYIIEIDEDSANRYLKGEVISINENIRVLNDRVDYNIKEYVILTYKNIGIGVGKLVDNKIKNLYPKGLRNL